MKYAQIVMGPAGAGKSTYCNQIQEHAANARRTVRVVNLDPAAEAFKYNVAFDIRTLVSVDEVMAELKYGPNGALVYCMEYLVANMDWLEEELESYTEDDYIIFDCPGQIELYTHIPVMRQVTRLLQREGFNVCGVYVIDAMFAADANKLLAGTLMALSAMVHLELPHVNVLTKCDLVDKEVVEKLLSPDGDELVAALDASTDSRFKKLNKAFGSLIDDYNLVQYVPLDISDDDSVATTLAHIDRAIQWGEDAEPKNPQDEVDDDVVDALKKLNASG